MSELGTLVIVVLKARDLPDKHTFSKQDPFAQLALGGKTLRTSIDAKGGQHPVWDEEIRMKVPKASDGKNRAMEVSCWAKEPREDELLGKGTVDITETLKTGEFDDWIQLENNGTQRGSLYLEMTFYAAGPAPLSRRPSKMKPAERLSRPAQVMQSISETPPETPPKTPPQSHLSPHTSPKIDQSGPYGRLGYSPPTVNGRLAPPSTLTPGPRNGSPKRGEPVHQSAPPPLLRPGNPNSPPKPVGNSRPLPPNDPVHSRLPDPWESSTTTAGGRASPPVSASAYPPSEGALGLLPLPGSLQAGGAGSRPGSAAGRAPASEYQVSSTPWRHPGGVGSPHPHAQSPPPSQQYQVSSTPWQHPGGTGPPHTSSPAPAPYQSPSTPWSHPGPIGPSYPSTTPVPTYQSPSAYGGGSSPPQAGVPSFPSVNPSDRFHAPQFPKHDTSLGPPPAPAVSSYNSGPSSYAAPPSFPMAMTAAPTPAPQAYHNVSPPRSYSPAYAPTHPSIPDPYNRSPAHTPVPQHLPPPTRQRLAFPDEGGLPTPKAELQPWHSPSQPTSHLRHSPPRAAAAPSTTRSSEGASAAGKHPSDGDGDVARELERSEQERARQKREDEERDLALARELDRALNG